MSAAATVREVAVTGVGVVSALGCTVESFWSRLLAGDSGVAPITDEALAGCRTQVFAAVQGFDPDAQITRRERQRLSLASQFAIVAARQALDLAGLDVDACRDVGMGAFIGGSAGGFVAVEPVLKEFFETRVADALCVPTVMNSAPTGNLSVIFGLTGPTMTFDVACASSAHAIGHAFELIRSGRLEAALVGGTDTPFAPGMISAWSALRVMSELNDPPDQACRPFSRDRGGMVLGEGAGMLVLESGPHAFARGATVLATISGYGASSDAHHMTRPLHDGIVRTMRLALDDASLAPDDIQHINAHATATRFNDEIETSAIKEVFGVRAKKIPVVGLKAALGHTLAAAGALECIAGVLSLRDQVLPPTRNVLVPDPACDLDYVVDGPREVELTHMLSNSFAFGGSNAVLALNRD